MNRHQLIVREESLHLVYTESGYQLTVRTRRQSELQGVMLEKMLCPTMPENPINSLARFRACKFQNPTAVISEG